MRCWPASSSSFSTLSQSSQPTPQCRWTSKAGSTSTIPRARFPSWAAQVSLSLSDLLTTLQTLQQDVDALKSANSARVASISGLTLSAAKAMGVAVRVGAMPATQGDVLRMTLSASLSCPAADSSGGGSGGGSDSTAVSAVVEITLFKGAAVEAVVTASAKVADGDHDAPLMSA